MLSGRRYSELGAWPDEVSVTGGSGSKRGLEPEMLAAIHSALLEDQRFVAITSRAIADAVRAAREGGFEAGGS